MHYDNIHRWEHAHAFGQEQRRPGEWRTMIVIVITTVMMLVEIVAGMLYGSMALLADGLHMGSHAVALAINAFAYVYTRRRARDVSFNFGTGKVNALGGFTGAVLLVLFALAMTWESLKRLVNPIDIAFEQAIVVAIVGLVVNLASMLVLGDGREHHEHAGEGADHHYNHAQASDHRHDDYNLRSAYLHVLADALTSLLAIVALLAAKLLGLMWMDPLMGIVGAVLVSRWSVSLLRTTSAVLLDKQGPTELREAIRRAFERVEDFRIADLHLWSVGPGIYALIVCLITHNPQPSSHYKQLIPDGLGLVHVTIEVYECADVDAGVCVPSHQALQPLLCDA
jgi:cation diffusion facilitator family transporter